jgi:hypothetical protein
MEMEPMEAAIPVPAPVRIGKVRRSARIAAKKEQMKGSVLVKVDGVALRRSARQMQSKKAQMR